MRIFGVIKDSMFPYSVKVNEIVQKCTFAKYKLMYHKIVFLQKMMTDKENPSAKFDEILVEYENKVNKKRKLKPPNLQVK